MTDPQAKPTSKAEPGPDGIVRSAAAHRKINEALAMLFRSPGGVEVLAYLRSITVNYVAGPEISDAGLRHREGMRHLVAIIEQRIEAHHRDQHRSTSRPNPRGRSRRRGNADTSYDPLLYDHL